MTNATGQGVGIRLIGWLALLLGAVMLSNGLIMLADPLGWYGRVPGVPRTGPFNPHFVRDIGLTYVLVGAGFIIGAFRPHLRVALWSAATLWLAGHALFHVWEVVAGICAPDALARDFAGVSLPALIGAALSIAATRA